MSTVSSLPPCGAVLGVDVGFSPKRRTSAVCRIDWDRTEIDWTVERFRATEPERSGTLARVADRNLLAAAFDGPLRRGFDEIGRYRIAEAMLTRRLQAFIGKPGQSSAPVGKMLNRAANECVALVLATGRMSLAAHTHRIDLTAVIEAFPSAFMGVMLHDPKAIAARRGDRSDLFYGHLAEQRIFDRLFEHLLPGRRLVRTLASIGDHDDRAGMVCALSALCVAGADYCAVGDDDGWIVLPPRTFIKPWAIELLLENAHQLGREALFI